MVTGRLLRAAVARYSRHTSSELAAALAYRILFSLVPFVALLAAVLDPFVSPHARADLVDWLLGAFPGTTIQVGVEQELEQAGALTSVAGLIAFGTLAWTASGMTRSLRVALAVVWETHEPPPFVRAKLRDLAALGVLAALLLAVFLLSLAAQIAVQAGADTAAAIGRRPRRVRVLSGSARELRHDLRPARRGAGVPRPALRGRRLRPVRRRARRPHGALRRGAHATAGYSRPIWSMQTVTARMSASSWPGATSIP